MQYQWAKNGAIADATSDTYTTPATVFSDTDASFTVAVSNSAGTIASNAASLTVTARAPMDLRFQQVPAASTVNGWGSSGAGLGTDIPGRGGFYYSASIHTMASPIHCRTGRIRK